jgi:large subunit ribosomal protein L30
MAKQKMVKVTLRRSTIGRKPRHVRTVRALGLKRIGDSRLLPDNESVRGMIRAVEFLIETEAVESTGTRTEE